MKTMKYLICLTVFFMGVLSLSSQDTIEKDIIMTDNGELELWFIGHGTLMFKYDGMIIHIDPVSREGDYSVLPDADFILITHEHGDHLDPDAISKILKSNTVVLCNKASAAKIENPVIMANGDMVKVKGIEIEAVPAYNIKHERSPGNPFHEKGKGNGYILNLGDKRIYVAGDTENIPEMAEMKNIDIAFLPMNLPYTMDPEMVASAALVLNPEILYPYHYGSTNTAELIELLKGKDIDIRIRNLQ